MNKIHLSAVHLGFLLNSTLLAIESFVPASKVLLPLTGTHFGQLALVVLAAISCVELWTCLLAHSRQVAPQVPTPEKAQTPDLPRVFRLAFLFDLVLLLIEDLVPPSKAFLPLGPDHLTQAAFVALLAAVILLIDDLR